MSSEIFSGSSMLACPERQSKGYWLALSVAEGMLDSRCWLCIERYRSGEGMFAFEQKPPVHPIIKFPSNGVIGHTQRLRPETLHLLFF